MIRRFIVPGKPTPKARARTTRQGHTYTPKQTQLAEGKVLECYLAEYRHLPPFDGPVILDVEANFEVPASWSKARKAAATWHTSRPDLDNIVKLVTDALNGVCFGDDSQVCEITARKCYTAGEPGRVVVQVIGHD
jgi:Holliday junction resolvase RusA-like endonuclease